MELQLTKTKTITIGGGVRKATEVTGVELFGGDGRGCPAVRLKRRRDQLEVVAVGFVPPPAGDLPANALNVNPPAAWSLPADFQAPAAALAVVSPKMAFLQVTADAFNADVAAGACRESPAATEGASEAPRRKLQLRRSSGEEKSATASADRAAAAPKIAVRPGESLTNSGGRFVMQPMPQAGGFVLEASLPECEASWVAQLLPEGRRPTAASIQVQPSALAASVLCERDFVAAKGSALAMFLEESSVSIAGYRAGELVLWHRCRNAPGRREVCEAIKSGLGLDDSMLAEVLKGGLIDPRPVLDPLLAPVFDDLAVSRDYLVGKLGVEPKAILLYGIGEGSALWREIAESRLGARVVVPGAFDGLKFAARFKPGKGVAVEGDASHVFLGALGAALAVLEAEVPPAGGKAK